MFRNQYDTDVTVWSPQGHLHQIDYAMEAVKQGSACLGLRSNSTVVLAGIKRDQSEQLADPQKKFFEIDTHMGMVIAGLTADARSLARFMRTECLNHKFVYGSALPVARLVSDVADKKQECTQSYVRRPYGVGCLVAGVDNGPHLFQTCPSGNYYEYHGIAIGARSQSARTYLEKHFESFPPLGKDDLIKHALQGIRGCLEGNQELSSSNVAIAVVGANHPFTLIEGADLQPYIDAVEVADVTEDVQMS
ncbi:hypothetical protein Ae201684P_007470 [Aphanomyces euteiches]|nr:hypothetical protein Ae201684P_007470 [Aphanomyces euteiches]